MQVQDPRHGRREADLVVAPSHDPIAGDNVFQTLGAVHRVTPERLEGDLSAAGLELVRWLTDPDELFALTLSRVSRVA